VKSPEEIHEGHHWRLVHDQQRFDRLRSVKRTGADRHLTTEAYKRAVWNIRSHLRHPHGIGRMAVGSATYDELVRMHTVLHADTEAKVS
jgi:hypothetical protein